MTTSAILLAQILLGLVGLVIICIFLYHSYQLFKHRKISGIGFQPLPLLGHSHLALQSMDKQLEIIANIQQNILAKDQEIGLAWLGPKPILLITGPTAAEQLLRSSQQIEKAFLYFPIRSWLGDGLLTSTGEKWKSRRRLLTPTFHFSILKDFLGVMNEQANVFLQRLDDFGNSAEYFDISKMLTLCALDIICETAMGKTIGAQTNEDSEYVKAIHRATVLIQTRQKLPWLWPDILFNMSPSGKKYNKNLKILHGFTRRVIEEKLNKRTPEKGKRRKAFMDLLITASEEGNILLKSDIQEEVDTFMFEGHDTTASAMSFALFLIGNYPKEQQKIYDELIRVIGKGSNGEIQINYENLKKLEYTEAAIKECLRMLPSVPMIGRKLSSDIIIDGVTIPKGMDCVIFLVFINNNEKYWDDYATFKPDRFLKTNDKERHPYSHVPFSAGPRNCIGQKFAMMEIKVILAKLLLRYSVKSKHDNIEDLKVRGDVILKAEAGVLVRLTPRET